MKSIGSAVQSTPPLEETLPSKDETFAKALEHLTYLGYEVHEQAPDGWVPAAHRAYYNLYLRPFDGGIRLFAGVSIAGEVENARAAWLEFLDTANREASVIQFSLFDVNGDVHVKMRATISGAYNRPTFAMMMDLWQRDQALLRDKPAFPAVKSASELERLTGLTVN